MSVLETTEQPKAKRSWKRIKKPRLLTPDQLDGRTNTAKFLAQTIAEMEEYLGGHDQLSPFERSLVEGYASAKLLLLNLTCRLAKGENISFSEHSQICSSMVQLKSALQTERRLGR